MKKLDKLILTLFSVIIFLQSVLIICIIAGWVDMSMIGKFANLALYNVNISRTILVITVICMLCSIKCIFFDSSSKEKKTNGVLMQNDNGKLLISKQTIENIVMGVVADFDSVDNVTVKTDMDNLNHLIVNVNLDVNENVVIKELTVNMQNKIKEAIKKTSDLDVTEVNVKVKDITKAKEIKD